MRRLSLPRKKVLIPLIAVLAIVIGTCHQLGLLGPQPGYCIEAIRLKYANVDQHVQLAVDQEDFRPLAVAGVGITAPGVAYWHDCQIHLIPGTTDALGSVCHGEFNGRARNYAERYNVALLSHPDFRLPPPKDGRSTCALTLD